MSDSLAIELQNVSVVFNRGTLNEVHALQDLSLAVQKGETLVITGGNGSGKSTLLRAIAGTAPVISGKVSIRGVDVTNWPPHRRARLLGFIYQDPVLGTCPNMTVHENFRLVSNAPWWSFFPERLGIEATQMDLIRLSGLPFIQKAGTMVNCLSGGQRQGAALIMALSSRRSILLMDEYTSSLDSQVKTACLEMIARESVRRELTILAVMHDPGSMSAINYRSIELENGRLMNSTRAGNTRLKSNETSTY